MMFTDEDLAGEEWRDIDGHDGYQVSDRGRIRSKTITVDDGRCVRTFQGKMLKLHEVSGGQLRVYLMRPEKKNLSVERLVADAFIPEEDGKDYILHKNFDLSDCSAQNLVRVTFDEVKEAYEHCPGNTDDWKDIPDTDGLYQICRDGRAMVHDKVVRVGNGYKIRSGQVLKPFVDEGGHDRYRFMVDGKMTNERVDYLVANAFLPCNNGNKAIMHADGDGHNSCVDNLIWVEPEQLASRNTTKFMSEIYDPNETWKPVDGFAGRYIVSDQGRVAYLPQCIRRNGQIVESPGGISKPFTDAQGYRHVTLTNDAGNIITVSVHRLVAKAFIPQPTGCNVVNHLDQTPGHDSACNLEWTDPRGNCVYADAIERRKQSTDYVASGLKRRKPILQFDLDGDFVKWWSGACEIEETLGFLNSSISSACHRRRGCESGNAYGYRWYFEEDCPCAG